MKFKLDENLPAELLQELRQAGCEVDSVPDEGLTGTADPILLRKARDEARVFLTMDKGIGNIRSYPPQDHAGIVLFRPPSAGRRAVFEFIRARLHQILDLELIGRLVVVTERGIRTR